MATNDYDDLLEELRERGLEDEDYDRLKGVLSASPIRKERDAAIAENRVLRERVAKAVFADARIKLDPSVLRYPDDLDITDVAKVREWGLTQGVAEPSEPSEEDLAVAEGLAASDRIANATAGAGTGVPAGDLKSRVVNELSPNLTEDQFWSKARELGVTQE